MKKVVLALVLFLASASAFAADAPEPAYDRVIRTNTLKCGYYPWPPYFIQDVNKGTVTGLAVDYADAIGDLLNLKVEYVQLSALGMQTEELKRGVYDAFCLDSYYVFSSIKFVDFSDAFYYAPVFAYVRSDETRFKSLGDMDKADVTFVGIDGDLSTQLVRGNFPQAKLIELPSNSDGAQLMMSVATKKADIAIIDPGIVEGFNKMNAPGLKIADGTDPVAVYPISFSVTKGEDALLRMLNGAVSALYNTGGTRKIVEKYNLPKDAVYLPVKSYEVPK